MDDPIRPPGYRAGDDLLDRYLPDADKEARERARDAFREWAFLILRIGERLDREEQEKKKSEKCSNSGHGLPESEGTENDTFGYYGA